MTRNDTQNAAAFDLAEYKHPTPEEINALMFEARRLRAVYFAKTVRGFFAALRRPFAGLGQRPATGGKLAA